MNPETVLQLTLYEPSSTLNQSDQISVPRDVWELFYARQEGVVFVGIEGTSIVGRIRPADSYVESHVCQLPEWMWIAIGCPEPDMWLTLRRCVLKPAGTIVLKPLVASSWTSQVEPLDALTAALSGCHGTPHSWACLSVGSDIPLSVGVFSVLDIRSADGVSVPHASILNVDVNLELHGMDTTCREDYERPPTPFPEAISIPTFDPSDPMIDLPSPIAIVSPSVRSLVSAPHTTTHTSSSLSAAIPIPTPPSSLSGKRSQPQSFLPFTGAGHRLG